MKKFLLMAVGAASLLAADIAAAQTQPAAPAPPSAPGGAPGFGRGGPGFGGPGFDRGGPGFERGGRFGMRGMHGMRGRFMRRPSLQDVEKRNAERFAKMDANRDGRVTFEEFRGFIERERTERQRQMFQRFTGGADSVTLDQLNARAAERMKDRGAGRGGPGGPPPAAPGQARPPAR